MNYKGIFVPGVYDDSTSLVGQIEKCIDVSVDITPEILGNLIIKYIFSYIYPSEIGTKVSEADINQFYKQALEYHRGYRGEKRTEVSDFAAFYALFQYQIGVAGDIAATIPLLQAIISKSIEKLIGESVVSVESGTGSGILQLARFIWAERNKSTLKTHNNIGIEVDLYTASRTQEILTNLRVGRILCKDSTDIQSYTSNNIPTQIHFFTNENIPRYGVTLREEPFIKNIFTLIAHVGEENFENIDLFPFCANFRHRVSDEMVTISGGRKSLRNLEVLKLMGKDISEIEKELVSLGISLDDRRFYEDQGSIGDEFIVGNSPQGFIHFQNGWYHRWKRK